MFHYFDDLVFGDEIPVSDIFFSRLKEKSTADGWTPKMIENISTVLYPFLVLIFNTILLLRYFPEKWCKSFKGFLLQFRIPGFEKKILRQRNDAAEFGGTQFVIDKTTPELLHVFFEPFTVFWLGG